MPTNWTVLLVIITYSISFISPHFLNSFARSLLSFCHFSCHYFWRFQKSPETSAPNPILSAPWPPCIWWSFLPPSFGHSFLWTYPETWRHRWEALPKSQLLPPHILTATFAFLHHADSLILAIRLALFRSPVTPFRSAAPFTPFDAAVLVVTASVLTLQPLCPFPSVPPWQPPSNSPSIRPLNLKGQNMAWEKCTSVLIGLTPVS